MSTDTERPVEALVRRQTCADCANLNATRVMNAVFYGCDKTGFVVPHAIDIEAGTATFWRVPLECPLPPEEAVKAEERAPTAQWEVRPLPSNTKLSGGEAVRCSD